MTQPLDLNETKEKRAPVQGYTQGIPWEMHLRAYNEYCKQYGPQKALIEGWCRGGFATGELDLFIPGWRDELEELPRLRTDLARHKAALKVATDALQLTVDDWGSSTMTMDDYLAGMKQRAHRALQQIKELKP